LVQTAARKGFVERERSKSREKVVNETEEEYTKEKTNGRKWLCRRAVFSIMSGGGLYIWDIDHDIGIAIVMGYP